MYKKEKIIIAGFSKLSNLIYSQLKQTHRYRIRVVDRKQIEDIDESRFTKGQISSGDVLIKAGVKNSEYLIIMTEDEDLNLMTALVASNLNSSIKIFVLINNVMLSRRIDSMYSNIHTISPQKIISPFIYSLSSNDKSIGFFRHNLELYNILTVDGEVQIERKKPAIVKKKKKHFNFFKKLLAYMKYYRAISKGDKLLNYTLISVLLFIIFMTLFVFSNSVTKTIIDGFYFAVTIITTIGFGDINFFESSQLAKFFGSLGMVFGAVLMTILNAAIVNILVVRTLKKSDVLLSAPTKDHTIICGIGNTGKEYIAMYKQFVGDDNLIGIDKSNIQDHVSNELGIPIIEGDAENEDNLDKINVKNATSLIITTESDITNVNISLLARYKNKDINIITRINNSSIARYLNTSDSKSRIIDVSHIISEVVMANIFFSNAVVGVSMEENRYILVLKVPTSYFEGLENISFAELDEDYQIEPLYTVMGVKKYDKLHIKEELILRTTIEQLSSIKSQMIEKFRCRFEFESNDGDSDSTDITQMSRVEKALTELDMLDVIGNVASPSMLIVNMSHGMASCIKAYFEYKEISYQFKYLQFKKVYGKLLLCENEVASKKNLITLFESMGYNIDVIDEGDKIEEVLHTKKYDILVINVMMSGIVPVELFKTLRESEIDEHLYIIGINDSSSVYENDIFVAAGIDHILERPFENKDLELLLLNYEKQRKNIRDNHRSEGYDLSEVLESVDNDFELFIKLFKKFENSYMKKIEAIMNAINSRDDKLILVEIKKLRSALSIFRIEEFIEDVNSCIDIASEFKYDDMKARIIQLSFKIQDFTLFIKLSVSAMNRSD